MSERPDPRHGDGVDDEQLLDELRSAVTGHDPPPDSLRDVAIRAYTWDQELQGLLVADAVTDEPVLLRDSRAEDASIMSADGHGHDQTFAAAGLTIELSVRHEPDGAGPIVDGVVVPAVNEVTLVHLDGRTVAVDCDRFGRFTVSGVTTTFAIMATAESGETIRTPLIDL
jgi:hypothetical protein